MNLSEEKTGMRIAVVLPVFNEKGTLRPIIEELLQSRACAIIVVDDGSSPVLKNEIAGMHVYYIPHIVNMGQGASLQTGFEFAKSINADIVVTMDADGQHQANDISLLIEPILLNEADVTLGSRFLEREAEKISIQRKLLLQLARVVNYFLSGIMLSDAHNGLRAFNRKSLEQISITENRMAHASEILFEIKLHKLRYKEIGVSIHYTEYSKQKGQSAMDSIKVLFDLILYKLFK